MKKVLLSLTFLFMAVSAYGKEYTQAYEDKLIQDLKGIYTQEAVKTPDNPTGHPVDATPIILQARHDFPFLSLEAQNILYSFFFRPSFEPDTEYTYNSLGTCFKIHFAKTGPNAVYQPSVDNNGNGVPDYVDSCASVLDYVWAKEVDTLGYVFPPQDGWYPPEWDNGGDGKYDIYLLNLGVYYLGYTSAETTNTIPPIAWTSFIVLDNDYLGFPPYHSQYEWLNVTVVHEFFHAIQFGYDIWEFEYVPTDLVMPIKPYWMEMSATWMEDQVFDYINDYIYYLRAFFNYPWLSLRTFRNSFDLHPYGSCIWPIFLGERFGINIIKDIWTKCAEVPGDNVLSATDLILKTKYGSSLNQSFQEFSVWNYFTADRANPSLFGFYSEGELFYDFYSSPIKVKETLRHTFYPVTDTVDQLPENLGTTYITFIPMTDSTGGLRVYYEGDIGAGWNASLIAFRGNALPFEDSIIVLDSITQSGTGVVQSWTRFSEISMVIARGDTISTSNFKYRYSGQYDKTLTGVEDQPNLLPCNFALFQNYPNPFNPSTAIPYTVYGSQFVVHSPVRTILKIYNILGELVRSLVDEEKMPGTYQVIWDGKDDHGEKVCSGVYFYSLKAGSYTESKKMELLK